MILTPADLRCQKIYFDNGATSYPKPESVLKAVISYMSDIGSNPGRSGHELSIESGMMVYKLRKLLTSMYGVQNPMRAVLCFNATDALNLAIKGMLKKGDHVITTSMEHNSVLRPLKYLEERGDIELSVVYGDKTGRVDASKIEEEIRGNTALVAVNHISNVNGIIQPIEDIGQICKNITFLVDASQSGGVVPFNMEEFGVDLVAITGHKSLYGPTGTGALIIGDGFDFKKLTPLRHGGTGSFSGKECQPDFLPDFLESGTLNMAGIAGWVAGIEHINEISFKDIQEQKRELVTYFITRAKKAIPGFVSLTPESAYITGVVSFYIEGISVTHINSVLNEDMGIMCRQGLHCAPLAHKTLGTFPEGTIRFSFGLFNSKDEIDIAIEVLKNGV